MRSAMRSGWLAGVLCVLAAVVAAAPALAADSGASQAVHYPLTMAKVRAYFTAQINMFKAVAASKDPKLADRMSIDGNMSFGQTVARYDAPPFRQAIAKAGLTPRDYVSISYAYIGAAFGTAYEKMKHGQLDKAYDRRNVDFYKAHAQELTAMQKQFMAEAQKLAPQEADEDTE